MKRRGGLYEKTCSKENLRLADIRARKGKQGQYGIVWFDRNREKNIDSLHKALINKTYRTSQYTTFIVREPKERIVYRLPYFPDRLVHHAALVWLEKFWTDSFVADTYSCIKGRGIHSAGEKLKLALKDTANAKYCLKLDVKKFYPSIDNEILKKIIRRKIKDKDLLWLLDEIIDSAVGAPIGNFLSQFFANLYLSGFDHWVKQNKKIKHYFRYCDDIVILGDNKEDLHTLLVEITAYLESNLKLTVKKNHQVFPVDARGIDFLGFVFRSTHTRLRKRIKQNFARAAKRRNPQSIASYMGWALSSDSKHLVKKLLPDHEEIFRLQHQARRQRIYRRKDQNR